MSKNNLVVERDNLAFTMSRIFDAPRELVWKVWAAKPASSLALPSIP